MTHHDWTSWLHHVRPCTFRPRSWKWSGLFLCHPAVVVIVMDIEDPPPQGNGQVLQHGWLHPPPPCWWAPLFGQNVSFSLCFQEGSCWNWPQKCHKPFHVPVVLSFSLRPCSVCSGVEGQRLHEVSFFVVVVVCTHQQIIKQVVCWQHWIGVINCLCWV